MISKLLEIKSLVKLFPGVTAVDSVSFDVIKGRCLGLLGPNGAGKTTTMEIIEGVQDPTSGDILYKSEPRKRNFQQEIGIQFQSTALPDFLTGKEVLRLFQSYYHKIRPIEELIEKCNLKEYLDRDTRKLSGGQRQRLLLALALINDPELVFLDEPTTGLDPQARRNFWELIEDIKKEGKTLIMSTHYMEEAYELCDDLIIMDHGKVIAEGEPKSLLDLHFDEKVIELNLSHLDITSLSDIKVYKKGSRYEIHTHDVSQALDQIRNLGVDLNRIQIKPKTLEDLFLELTGKELRG